MAGPMAGAKVAVTANSAMPIGRRWGGRRVSPMLKAGGMKAPPHGPCRARKVIMLCSDQASEQSSEEPIKPIDSQTVRRRAPSSSMSQTVSGMMMTAIKAPSIALRTAIQSRRLGSRSAGGCSVTAVHRRHYRHAGTKALQFGGVLRQADFYRHALDHLGEVAGGVVRRQQAEFGTGGGIQAVEGALQAQLGESIEAQFDLLLRMHARDLGFLEVGLHPDAARHQGEQRLARAHVLPFA